MLFSQFVYKLLYPSTAVELKVVHLKVDGMKSITVFMKLHFESFVMKLSLF
jgi:hypothetical protein